MSSPRPSRLRPGRFGGRLHAAVPHGRGSQWLLACSVITILRYLGGATSRLHALALTSHPAAREVPNIQSRLASSRTDGRRGPTSGLYLLFAPLGTLSHLHLPKLRPALAFYPHTSRSATYLDRSLCGYVDRPPDLGPAMELLCPDQTSCLPVGHAIYLRVKAATTLLQRCTPCMQA